MRAVLFQHPPIAYTALAGRGVLISHVAHLLLVKEPPGEVGGHLRYGTQVIWGTQGSYWLGMEAVKAKDTKQLLGPFACNSDNLSRQQ